MNSFFFVLFVAAFAAANAGVIKHTVIPGINTGSIIQGPSTRTTVVGPDGSAIEAAAPGGVVSTAVDVGYAAHTAAVVATPVVSAYTTPVVAAHGVAPVVSAYSAPVVAAHGVVAKTLVASPLTESGYPLLAPGSGIEGQYVHDYTEKLYDDGSYKGEIYH